MSVYTTALSVTQQRHCSCRLLYVCTFLPSWQSIY